MQSFIDILNTIDNVAKQSLEEEKKDSATAIRMKRRGEKTQPDSTESVRTQTMFDSLYCSSNTLLHLMFHYACTGRQLAMQFPICPVLVAIQRGGLQSTPSRTYPEEVFPPPRQHRR